VKFKLEFNFPVLNQKINYRDNLFFIGSCFAENIAHLFKENYFSVYTNPNGIVYNPKSIFNQLQQLIRIPVDIKDEVFLHNDQWHSFDFHGDFSAATKEQLLLNISNSYSQGNSCLKNAKVMFVTFGSAFVYLHQQRAVSNCHKLPAKAFEKILLTKEEIVRDFISLIKDLHELNPELQFVFTVSPVRYIRDGIIENNLSKSILIQSIHEIIKACKNCFYFPAYEIVIDELRDYRFFKDDFVHPNNIAINYVWERLTTWMDTETLIYLKEITEFNNFKNHRVLNIDKQIDHQEKILHQKKQLESKYTNIKITNI
jgi:hypothetical protein